MGRGRAKAKQQKVARELKYSGQFTDLDALQRELGATSSSRTNTVDSEPEYSDEDDDWTATGH
jgi:phage terminase small subunit